MNERAILASTFGYIPDESRGERWIIHGRYLIVIHPERKPRVYEPGCAGSYHEIEIYPRR